MENLPSTSSSSQSFYDVYDVFINHRGPDVKTTLAQPLYHRLRDDLHLQVFLDKEELQIGDIIPSSIAHAIKKASLHIAIFSKNYAQSPWCLDELYLMLDSGAVIFPVFYDVKPSDLRWTESGVYADAFRGHQRKKRYEAQILQKWKEALNKVSYRTGLEFDSTSEEDHGSLLQRIVISVSKHIKMELEVADHAVGLDEDIQELETIMAEHENQGENMVKVVGIFGMGGSGKTTLTRELYNRKKSEYGNKSCFLFDVRESSVTKGLECLQSMLLNELGFPSATIYSTNYGKEFLRRQLRGKRVLIILDDIDHVDQLEALLVKDVLGYDSLVLITTRNRKVLKEWGISILYEKKGMNRKNATELFCWHAFLRRHPMNGYEDLVERFLDACQGLPLALKVIGRQLRGEPKKSYWEGELRKIGKKPPPDVTKILKISYDALDEEQKEIFLDIACFFVGEDKGTAVSIWEASEWHGLHALQILEDRCLVDFHEIIRRGHIIRMHDHVRDMGRDIAKSTGRPRLRRPFDTGDDRSNFLELMKRPSEDALNSEVGSRILYSQSNALQFLAVDGNCSTHKCVKLLWLRLEGDLDHCIPSFLPIENLRVLEIRDRFSRLERLWDGRTSQALLHLRELRLTCELTLADIAESIGSLVNLRTVILTRTGSRTPGLEMELPDEFCFLRALERLELHHYAELTSLPTRFGDLTNLQHLDLSACLLQTLPDSFRQLTQLRYLSISGCWRLMVPQDMFGNISTLEHLKFRGCGNLEVLPIAVTRQRHLRTLCLIPSPLKDGLPNEIGELRNLEVLEVGSKFMTMLPSSLGNLCRLKELRLTCCEKLRSLPESVGLLKRLETLRIYDSGMERLPEGVAHLTGLQYLRIDRTPICRLTLRKSELQDENYMPSFTRLRLSSTKTTFISIAENVCRSLVTLVVDGCLELEEVELALPTTLTSLTIADCPVLKRITGFSDLAKLRSLNISKCVEVEKLPSLARLTSLNELEICGCGKLENIEGVGQLSSLKVLNADSCWSLRSIEGLDRLQGLNHFQISSDKWTDIEGLQRACARSSTSIVTAREVAEDVRVLSRSISRLFPTSTIEWVGRSGSYPWQHRLSEVNTCTTLVMCVVFRTPTGVSWIPRTHSHQTLYGTRVEKGRWISVGVFTENSEVLRALKAASDSDGFYLYLNEYGHWKFNGYWQGENSWEEGETEESWAALVRERVEAENISKMWREFLARVFSPR